MTNYHVIRGSRNVAVSIKKGKAIRARIIGVEPRKDIAVLQINPKYITHVNGIDKLSIADSTQIQVGQKAIAIGNPYGLDRTLTTGIISAVGRKVPGVGGVTIRDMLQTDASINPGNSGGPLLNSQGQLMGMNTAVVSRRGAATGIGFAVPANAIKRIVSQIIQYGRVIQAGIGINRLPDRMAKMLGIKGVIIAEVVPGTPAAKAGIKGAKRDRLGQLVIGDVIVEVDSKPVKHYGDLYNIMTGKQVGNVINLTLRRNGNTRTIKIRTIDASSMR